MARPHILEVRERFLACRGPIRHRWELVVSSPHQRPTFGVLALFQCDNCGSQRHDIFSRTTGELLSRHYDHPDGYKETGSDMNGNRLTSSDLRREWAAMVASRDLAALLEAEEEVVTPLKTRKRVGR